MRCPMFLAALLALGVVACVQTATREETALEGVWEINEIRRKDGGEAVTRKPPPSLVIFAPNHYSMVWDSGIGSRRAFAERWNPTDAEKMERYDSFVVNSGTYEIEESAITMNPVVARVPEFMGGTLVCEFRLEGETLLLTMVDEYSYDGVQAPWVASGGGLILELVRIDP